MGGLESEENEKEYFKEYNVRFPTWENYVKFEPLVSYKSYKIREAFMESNNDKYFSEKLAYALSNRKPFAHFKNLIDASPYRQQWFAFKQQWLEEVVRKDLIAELEILNNEQKNNDSE